MKALSSALLFFAASLLCVTGAAQGLPAGQKLAGFVFANAIGIEEKADITANGKKLTSNGIAPGIASSGLGLPVGSYQIQVTAPGCEVANTAVQLAVGTTPILIAYLERVTDPKTNQTKNYIRLLQVPAQPQTGKYLINALSVDPTKPISVSSGGRVLALEFRKPVAFEGKTLRVSAENPADAEEASAEEKGSYYCVLFRRPNGKATPILIPERIYQW